MHAADRRMQDRRSEPKMVVGGRRAAWVEVAGRGIDNGVARGTGRGDKAACGAKEGKRRGGTSTQSTSRESRSGGGGGASKGETSSSKAT